MTDTIIFDLDGTLLNTLDDLTDSTNYALSACGYPKRSYEEIRSFVGNGVRLLIERAVPKTVGKPEIDECFDIFTKHYDKNKNNKTRPYVGIVELLRAVKSKGYRTAIVSNKYDSAVRQLADELFSGCIDVAVGESAGRTKKPAPDGVFAALSMLGSTTKTSVYIGDSDVDGMTANNAGLRFIAVTWGFRDRELLRKFSPIAIIDSPEDLLSVLATL